MMDPTRRGPEDQKPLRGCSGLHGYVPVDKIIQSPEVFDVECLSIERKPPKIKPTVSHLMLMHLLMSYIDKRTELTLREPKRLTTLSYPFPHVFVEVTEVRNSKQKKLSTNRTTQYALCTKNSLKSKLASLQFFKMLEDHFHLRQKLTKKTFVLVLRL